MTRQQSIWSEDAQKFIYDFYACSLFLLFEFMPLLLISFCNMLFRVAATRHRGAASSLLFRRQCSFFVVFVFTR